MALLDHQLLCLTTDLVQLDPLEDLEVQDMGTVVQDTDLVMDQEHLQLPAMVHLKALAMDNLLNSSNNILTRFIVSCFACKYIQFLFRASRHLRHQHNSRHRRSDGIGKAKMIYTMFCAL